MRFCVPAAATFIKTGGMDRGNYALGEPSLTEGFRLISSHTGSRVAFLSTTELSFHRAPTLLVSAALMA